ncbi:dual specificity protein phosphatase family protein [Cellulophaga baltica]|uniref:dual specificity protein phosphatase family protein n=1 Tax=Cellulophaga TaxID=104264 RepID=UPI001C066984|nr:MULTISPECIES: dual specificity protein phosphatase family protein [Cellulophaga]MBU2995413.1 dual specificity protein phosphatase family protein [Cellulophaga baltica]MDO6766807.1 dual specificity protein phosphatase family protein [Cellulophaga sp. 1_MG-2023]
MAQNDAKKIISKHFKNLYQINDSLYRSEQFKKKGVSYLQSLGISTIINLRRVKTDDKKIKGTTLKVVQIPMKAGILSEKDITKALKAIKKAKHSVLVHCWHGSDRTGAVIAAYRMVFESWTKEDAIKEFRRVEFGYHEKMYPNLIELLRDLDVEKIKNKLD